MFSERFLLVYTNIDTTQALDAGVNSMSCLIKAALKRGGTPSLDIHGQKLLIYGRAVINILYLLLCGQIRLFTAVVMFVNG